MQETAVLIIEDDSNIADLLEMYLRKESFRVLVSRDGEQGLSMILDHQPRVVILDIGLGGGLDGLEVCRRIRADDGAIGIIMLTARDDEIDRVLGLGLGADDYVTKPFSAREVVARVQALLRRSDVRSVPAHPLLFEVADIRVDTGRREVRVAGASVAFTAREFDLLVHFCRNRGLVLSRRQLLDGVWGMGWVGDERTVDVHVRQLRKKLGDSFALTTVWGIGYRLD